MVLDDECHGFVLFSHSALMDRSAKTSDFQSKEYNRRSLECLNELQTSKRETGRQKALFSAGVNWHSSADFKGAMPIYITRLFGPNLVVVYHLRIIQCLSQRVSSENNYDPQIFLKFVFC